MKQPLHPCIFDRRHYVGGMYETTGGRRFGANPYLFCPQTLVHDTTYNFPHEARSLSSLPRAVPFLQPPHKVRNELHPGLRQTLGNLETPSSVRYDMPSMYMRDKLLFTEYTMYMESKAL